MFVSEDLSVNEKNHLVIGQNDTVELAKSFNFYSLLSLIFYLLSATAELLVSLLLYMTPYLRICGKYFLYRRIRNIFEFIHLCRNKVGNA